MPPVVIAAGIGAAAGIGGAVLSSSAQKKAASKAADSAANTAASNNALQKEIYGKNAAMLNPYVTRGNEAGSAINALLGISGTSPSAGQVAPQPAPTGGMPSSQRASSGGSLTGFALRQWLGGQEGIYDRVEDIPNAMQATQTTQPVGAPVPVGGAAGIPGQAAYNNAFQNYLGSTGYQFQVDQGTKAINQGYAANNSLQSGAALKALQTYGQNTATGFFKDYLGLLGNQQGVGLSGASAVAGVGQNYANQTSANNNNASAAQQQAYTDRGNAQAGMYGSIAGGISGVANAFGSSYRP